MNYALSWCTHGSSRPIARFARVSHVRDFCLGYGRLVARLYDWCKHALDSFLFPLVSGKRKAAGRACKAGCRVQGPRPWCLRGMSEAQRLERQGGSCGGTESTLKYPYIERAKANGVFPLIACASTQRSRVSRAPGHSLYYLIITVPIDTIFIINDLQIFSSKRWWHFVLF